MTRSSRPDGAAEQARLAGPDVHRDVGYPHPSSPAARRVMLGNRRRDTTPEIRIRSILHRRGYRFRKDQMVRLGTTRTHPDILFTRQRVAVYVDGCFWHCCPDHGTIPQANREYWMPKLAANVARDKRATQQLRDHGWTVLRIWEHVDPLTAADRIMRTLDASPRSE